MNITLSDFIGCGIIGLIIFMLWVYFISRIDAAIRAKAKEKRTK